MTYVKFTVKDKSLSPEKREALDAAFKALQLIRGEVVAEWRASPEGIACTAMSFSKMGSSVNANWSTMNTLDVTVEVREDYEAKKVGLSPALSIGEKTINALLTGKLLSDSEKKSLLKRIGVDLDSAS